MNILHYTTYNEDCGISKYIESILDEFKNDNDFIHNICHPSPTIIRTLHGEEYKKVIDDFKKAISSNDILHIQHEFSFFPKKQFGTIIKLAKNKEKKVVITLHTSPNVILNSIRTLHVNSIKSIIKNLFLISKKIYFYLNFILPLRNVDMIIVHNETTQNSLTRLGIPQEKIKMMPIPVPKAVKDETTINKTCNDFLTDKKSFYLAIIGFIHQFKNIDHAIKSLKLLPNNYKLIIIGGLHPYSDATEYYNEISTLIIELDLTDRVLITGFINDDVEMNSIINKCDICLFPYDQHYYSNVSSASLANSFANGVPIIAYPTDSFKEIVKGFPKALTLTNSFNFYELVRCIIEIDLNESRKYACAYAHENDAYKAYTFIKSIYKGS